MLKFHVFRRDEKIHSSSRKLVLRCKLYFLSNFKRIMRWKNRLVLYMWITEYSLRIAMAIYHFGYYPFTVKITKHKWILSPTLEQPEGIVGEYSSRQRFIGWSMDFHTWWKWLQKRMSAVVIPTSTAAPNTVGVTAKAPSLLSRVRP